MLILDIGDGRFKKAPLDVLFQRRRLPGASTD
jgi:hypothetical protein